MTESSNAIEQRQHVPSADERRTRARERERERHTEGRRFTSTTSTHNCRLQRSAHVWPGAADWERLPHSRRRESSNRSRAKEQEINTHGQHDRRVSMRTCSVCPFVQLTYPFRCCCGSPCLLHLTHRNRNNKTPANPNTIQELNTELNRVPVGRQLSSRPASSSVYIEKLQNLRI